MDIKRVIDREIEKAGGSIPFRVLTKVSSVSVCLSNKRLYSRGNAPAAAQKKMLKKNDEPRGTFSSFFLSSLLFYPSFFCPAFLLLLHHFLLFT
jgi:hypothetical protein